MDLSCLAAFRPSSDGGTLELVKTFRHPVEKVWASLTIPARLAAWMGVEWLGGDAPLREGAAMAYRFTDMGIENRGRVLRCEPPVLLEHSFCDNHPPGSVVTWVLSPEPSGCRLTLTHRFRASDDAPRTAAGWTQLLDRLEAVLGDTPLPTGDLSEWRNARDRFASSFPPAASRDGRRIIVDGIPCCASNAGLHAVSARLERACRSLDDRALAAGRCCCRAATGRAFSSCISKRAACMHGTIIRWEPPQALEYTWPEDAANGDSTVLFELRQDVTGSILVLTHTLRGGGDAADFASGWHWHLDALDMALDGINVDFDRSRWGGAAADLRRHVVVRSGSPEGSSPSAKSPAFACL